MSGFSSPGDAAGAAHEGSFGRSRRRFGRRLGVRRRVNTAVGQAAGRIDARTGASADHAARLLAASVRLLRIPSAILLALSAPFLAMLVVLTLVADGAGQIVIGLPTLVGVSVWATFAWRRKRLLDAVAEPEALATELAIMVTLADKVDETRGVLDQIAGGGGLRMLSRLRGAWNGVQTTGRWIERIDDLPRARYFAPPRIGTGVSLAIGALWLVPLSIVGALFAAIGLLAGSLG